MSIDLPALRKRVAKLAEENPDMQFSADDGCVYFDQDAQPVCIVGRAMAAEGIDYEAFWAMTNDALIVSPNTEVFLDLIYSMDGVGVNDDDAHWISVVQSNQDVGETWATAVKNADEALATGDGEL